MLDQKDLNMIRQIMKEEVGESEMRMTKKIAESEERMTEKIAESEERMKIYVHNEIRHSENLVLSEVDRVHELLSGRMDRMEAKMDELCQYYRIDRLENTNASLVLKKVDNLEMRVRVLEEKTA